MKINVEKENLEKLAQIIYLGDIVINGYKKSNELKTDYSMLAEDIYGQILENLPQVKSKYKYKCLRTSLSRQRYPTSATISTIRSKTTYQNITTPYSLICLLSKTNNKSGLKLNPPLNFG